MKITIDKEACKKNGISIGEVLSLLLIINDVDIGKCNETLISTGLITSAGSNKLRLTRKGTETINNVIVDSTDRSENEDERFERLAEKLKELYPTGRKEGTNYMWRGTTAEIVRKLRTLKLKYNFTFTDEQAIKATSEYIKSFNGNYRFMQLLKYFLLKTTRDVDGNIEVKSEFMSLIENEGQVDSQRDDWMSTII